MTAADCPSPSTCPVPEPDAADLRRLRLAHLETGRVMERVYDRAHGVTGFNASGRGNGRFSPLPGRPHAYVGTNRTVALLETVFHAVVPTRPRVVYAATDLAGRGLGRVAVTRRLPLVDLRDPALQRLGLDRSQLTATSPAHYPCTRQWALRLAGRRIGGVETVGFLWNSRVAELAAAESPLLADLLGGPSSEVGVLYDDDGGSMLQDAGGGFEDLVGPTQGALLLDKVAEQLDAVIF